MGLLINAINQMRRLVLWALASMLLLVSNAALAAPSGCGALWGVKSGAISYFNKTSNSWVDVGSTVTATVGANGMAGNAKDGNLYFTNSITFSTSAPTMALLRANFNGGGNNVNTSGTVTFSNLGTITIPTSMTYTSIPGGATNTAATVSRSFFVGATFDRDTVNPRLFFYVTTGQSAALSIPIDGAGIVPTAAIGMIGMASNPDSPGAVSWSTLYQSSATNTVTFPMLGTGGDIYIDQGNQAWLVSNSNLNLTPLSARLFRLDLGISGSQLTRAKVDTKSLLTVGGATTTAVFGSVAVDPVTGRIYVASATNTHLMDSNYYLAPASIDSQLISTHSGLGDAGNCVEPPDPPTISKSFNPTSATTPSTTTLTITIRNPNKLPLYLAEALVDSLPSGLVVSSAPNLATATSCFSTDGPVTLPTGPTKPRIEATAGGSSVTVTSGIMIPGGGTSPFGGSCTFSVNVTATLAAFYPNSIAAGALKTTSGDNANAATATYQITSNLAPNPPTISKSFSPITESATVGTTTLTLIVVNPNSITNTLTTALLDNFSSSNLTVVNPAAITATCFSAGVGVSVPAATTLTAPSINSLQLANGSLIPGGTLPDGGSCSFIVQLTATVPSFNLNNIPAGSLTMVSGSNVSAASATFYLRGSDFGVTKSQRSGETGATTTGVINVPVSQTISYVIQIRNLGGVAGTRGFTDTIPALITPVISVTAAAVGTGSCTTATNVLGNETILRGTVTGVPFGSGCDVTIVAKSSATSVLSAATNTVGIYVINSEVETSTVNDSATVVLNIKPSVNLTITKTNGTVTVLPSSTTAYTITVANTAGATATGALVKDPAVTGLSCTSIACTAQGAAICPTSPLISALQGTGITIPSLPAGTSVSFVLTCDVTATGL